MDGIYKGLICALLLCFERPLVFSPRLRERNQSAFSLRLLSRNRLSSNSPPSVGPFSSQDRLSPLYHNLLYEKPISAARPHKWNNLISSALSFFLERCLFEAMGAENRYHKLRSPSGRLNFNYNSGRIARGPLPVCVCVCEIGGKTTSQQRCGRALDPSKATGFVLKPQRSLRFTGLVCCEECFLQVGKPIGTT